MTGPGRPTLAEQAEAAMLRCAVCGSHSVRHLGPLHAPTVAECTFCGVTEDLRPPPRVGHAPRAESLAGGRMLSPAEQADYARMFGLDGLEELLRRGPEG